MDWKTEWKPLSILAAVFLAAFYLPVGRLGLDNPVGEALRLLNEYAREHVLLCLVPAFFIAGAIAVFISQDAVIRYLGADAKKWVSYSVASVSGSILAVCSCTVLPLFAGIHRRGAGLGPAIAFLYAGPAVNILAIILTARILGVELGIARAIGAVVFSVVIGLLMAAIFRDRPDTASGAAVSADAGPVRPLRQSVIHMAFLVGILVFANWNAPAGETGFWYTVFRVKWWITGAAGLGLAWSLHRWFGFSVRQVALAAAAPVALALIFPSIPLLAFGAAVVALSVLTSRAEGESGEWFESSWGLAKQILPLLFAGVLVAGALLGRPGHEGLIPSEWVSRAVGGNSLAANLFASVAGAFMYFATLTEVPILQGLIGSGMGKGPSLALLLAGPALSLPNMLVINGIIGAKRTIVFVGLVVVMATASGYLYGLLF
ncbi:MAG TPA: permease [Acidobacteriota bacterium]|nr:permease [Acidobacteriota bacterium]